MKKKDSMNCGVITKQWRRKINKSGRNCEEMQKHHKELQMQRKRLLIGKDENTSMTFLMIC